MLRTQQRTTHADIEQVPYVLGKQLPDERLTGSPYATVTALPGWTLFLGPMSTVSRGCLPGGVRVWQGRGALTCPGPVLPEGCPAGGARCPRREISLTILYPPPHCGWLEYEPCFCVRDCERCARTFLCLCLRRRAQAFPLLCVISTFLRRGQHRSGWVSFRQACKLFSFVQQLSHPQAPSITCQQVHCRTSQTSSRMKSCYFLSCKCSRRHKHTFKL